MGMRLHNALISVALLASSPALALDRGEANVGGIPWKVIVKGDQARATRQGFWMYQTIGANFFHSAKLAVEQVSGCRVTDLSNNRHVVYAQLDCSEKSKPG